MLLTRRTVQIQTTLLYEKKMKKLLKFISIVLSVALLAAAGGCTDPSEPEKEQPQDNTLLQTLSSVPVYEDHGEKMLISYMNEMRPVGGRYDEAFQILQESGINAVFSWGYSKTYEEYSEKYGLDYMPHIYEKMPEQALQEAGGGEFAANVTGFNYFDEPAYNKIDDFVAIAENHEENWSDKLFYINLHPCWFEDEYEPGKTLDGHNYTEYIAHYCDTIFSRISANRFLSVDYYPLLANGTIKDAWLYTYENVAEYAKEYDATFHFYLATTEHNGYRKTDLNNLRYTINVAMTYGGQAMSYFNYVSYNETETWKNGLVSVDGLTRYDEYYMAQQVNGELLKWDHVFLNFDWQSVMCVEGTSDGVNPLFSRLQFNVDSIDIIEGITASEDTLVGRFTGKEGEIGLMVTNLSDPIYGKTDTVSLDLLEATKAIVYVRGEQEVIDLQNGTLNLTILPGDAAFVIPLEIK